jgi:hypothetical protein
MKRQDFFDVNVGKTTSRYLEVSVNTSSRQYSFVSQRVRPKASALHASGLNDDVPVGRQTPSRGAPIAMIKGFYKRVSFRAQAT